MSLQKMLERNSYIISKLTNWWAQGILSAKLAFTTPWTLPANNGLAVGEKIKYNLIETFNKYTESKINVIIAEKCIEKFFDSNNLKTTEELIFDKQNFRHDKEVQNLQPTRVGVNSVIKHI